MRVLLIVSVVLTFLAAPVRAQPGMMGGGAGGMGQMFEPAVTTRDLERYGEFLSLTAEQQSAAAALLEGYQEEFDRSARAMRDVTDAAREEFRDTRDMSIWDDVRPKIEEFRLKRKKQEEAFLTDFKAILTDEQSTRWPKLERLRLRDTTMRRGFISGESVDVIRLADDSKLSPESMEKIGPALDQYEMEVDRLLTERNKLYEDGMSRGLELWRAGDMAAITEIFNKAREAAVKVRDANRRAARQVEGLLSEGERAEFTKRFKEAALPRVYREAYPARAFSLASKFEDLTEDQKAQIAEIQASYGREAEPANQRWADAVEKSELAASPMEMMSGGGSPEVRNARKARMDLDERFVTKLQAILTPDQVKRLPDKRNREEENNREQGAPAERRRSAS